MENEQKLLILASASPRRQQLLREAGVAFRVDAPDVEEKSEHPDFTPSELAQWNARHKAEVVAARNPDAPVLAADTVVVCEGRVLGKPSDLDEAREMLRWLSGKTHEVLTAVVWLSADRKNNCEAVARTRVTFRVLDEAAISDYLSTVHVLDKAGAYALQENGESIIESIEGSRTNVIGLPMEMVGEWLK
ncbi:MAG: nucleoside triphosphate pyrophosphatase [bacterium]